MKKDEFFTEISKLCGYVDEKTIESMYYAMLRVISRQLRGKNLIELPDLGKFYLHRHKPRMSLDINRKIFTGLAAKTTLKFDPDYKIRKYFHDFEI